MDSAQRVQTDEDERRPLLDGRRRAEGFKSNAAAVTAAAAAAGEPAKTTWVGRNQWIVLAMASGACAAFNGAFAKL